MTYADTGEPVPHAPLEVTASRGRVGLRRRIRDRRRWAVPRQSSAGRPHLQRLGLSPGGAALPHRHERLDWPKGALEQSLDLALPRGVLIRGKVTEEGSGKPVPGATVDFSLVRDAGDARTAEASALNTASDGSFQLGAVPSPGYLFVKGPSDDYVLQTIGDRDG